MFVNLTPHRVNIHGKDGKITTVEPSGQSMRIQSESKLVREQDGIEFYSVEYGQFELIDNSTKSVVGSFPDKKDGVIYIVSGLVLDALGQLTRFFEYASPGELVRDANGQPIGCKGLRVH